MPPAVYDGYVDVLVIAHPLNVYPERVGSTDNIMIFSPAYFVCGDGAPVPPFA